MTSGSALFSRPYLVPVVIWGFVVAILAVTLYCLSHGINTVFMHLYYLPLILIGYYYRRKGIPGIILVSAAYFILASAFTYPSYVEIGAAALRSGMFVIIGIVVAELAERLFRRQEELRNVIENIQDVLFRIDTRGNLLMASPSFATLLGYPSLEECLGRNLSSDFLMDSSEGENFLEEVRNKGKVSNHVMTLKRSNGMPVPVSVSSHLFYQSDGSIEGIEGIFHDITELRKEELARKQSEQTLSSIINFLPDATFVIDKSGTVIAWNRAVEELTGVPASEMIGKSNYEYSKAFYGYRHPILIDQVLQPGNENVPAGAIPEPPQGKLITETEITPENGRRAIVWAQATPLYDLDGIVTGAIETVRDITSRRKSEEALREALLQKDILLKEIHHRVKNNIQVISSLLSLQSRTASDDVTKEILRDAQNRIRSIALVHEQLYKGKELVAIDYNAYLVSVINYLYHTYGVKPEIIQTKIHADKVFLNMDQAVPCSLIINEMITNSFKHAFPGGRRGEITIDVTDDGKDILIHYRDNGIGIPGTIPSIDTSKSLGMNLINGLTRQLNGTIRMDCENGVDYLVSFKKLSQNGGSV
ncbi:MAG: PAS domain S-box protein [Methanoregulaceae archaeon]|jgi:PAS domain S-box-containing protein|nr:PAS domain S-box protein [Methanoregulaceae archaeon]